MARKPWSTLYSTIELAPRNHDFSEFSMVWDGLFILLLVTLAVAGWTIGILNSWRGPIAIVVATVATQQLYIDFATWIVQQLRVQPDTAVAMAYLLLWGAIEITCEIILNLVLQFGSKHRPMLFERIAGALLGIVKAVVVVMLPLMVIQVENKVPAPPPTKNHLKVMIGSGIEESTILKVLSGYARELIPSVGAFVVSTKEPSFKPDFRTKKIEE